MKEQKHEKHFPLYLYNTLGREKQVFESVLPDNWVRMYNCGPTVYDVAHIGNFRAYIFPDTLRKVLEYNGMKVRQVINITDFGHLSSDGDTGDDKMTKGLKRDGLEVNLENMKEMAEGYAQLFIKDLETIGIPTGKIQFPRASDYIPHEIALVETLQEKGYAYRGKEGVYFDTEKFKDYGKLGNIQLEGLLEGARVASYGDKHNPTDFLLWKLDPKMGWDSPWGKGFPGWHIECSAMIRATLGEQMDIHTGGIDLMPTHHNNEIAQSECATGKKPFSRFWMHNEFLNIKDEKISKSLGNIITLDSVVAKGIHPFALRYLFLGAHYRTPLNFTWESLEASETAFLRLHKLVASLPDGGVVPEKYRARFHERINDDLDTPGALGVMWEMIKDSTLSPADIRAGLIDIDRVFGLKLANPDESILQAVSKRFGEEVSVDTVPEEIQLLLKEREDARSDKNWARADELRDLIAEKGYKIQDDATGVRVVKV